MRFLFNKCVILVLLLILLVSNYSMSLDVAALPEYLDKGSYAQYEQRFSTGDVFELFWNITHVNTSAVGITIRSHGIQQNQTTEELLVGSGGGLMLISKNTLTIIQFISDNMTITFGYPIGEKVPFWIPVPITQTTPIDTMYDLHVTPSSDSLNLSCLPSIRECWVTNNVYSEESSMERWYDKETGIVLKIQTNITLGSSNISCLETLNATNIQKLRIDSLSNSSPGFLGFEILLFLLFPFFSNASKRKEEKIRN